MAKYTGKLMYSDVSGGFWSLIDGDDTVYQLASDNDMFSAFTHGDNVVVETDDSADEMMGIGMVGGGVLVVKELKKHS